MTHEEILAHMQEKMDEELSYTDQYLNMVDSAMKMPESELNHKLITGIAEMAHDEYTHAEFICDMIEEFGGTVPAEKAKKMEEIYHRLERHFQ